MHLAPIRFGHLPFIGSALLLALAGCGGTSAGGTGGTTGSAGNNATAGTNGGTAGTSGGTSGTTGTAGTSGGTAGTSGGTSGTTGTAGTNGGTTGTAGASGTAGAGATGGSATGGSGNTGRGGTAGGGTAGRGGTTGTAGTGTAGRGGTTGSGGAMTQTSTNVTTFHNNLGRTGVYVDAALTRAAAAGIHVDTAFANTAIMGPVYAQPLYLGGAGTSQPDMVIVATAQNRVYALNASTGAEVWQNMQYGPPVTTQLDINTGNRPLLPFGVVGTPTLDPATRTLYFNAATNVSSTIRHRIHAVDLTNGMEKTGWPVNVETAAKNAEGGAFIPTNQNQRAAAALVGGRVFVPYSGHIGDADNYHGWVVGVSTTTPTDVVGWSTRAPCGGIWGTSGIASEGTNVIFTTGNTKASASGGFSAPSTYGDGEAVYKLGTSLTRTTTASDFWVPSNWSSLDSSDTDISGSGDHPVRRPRRDAVRPGPGAREGWQRVPPQPDDHGRHERGVGADPEGRERDDHPGWGRVHDADGDVLRLQGRRQRLPDRVDGRPDGGQGQRGVAAGDDGRLVRWTDEASNPIVTMSNAQGADAIVWVVGTNGQVNALNADTGASSPQRRPIAPRRSSRTRRRSSRTAA